MRLIFFSLLHLFDRLVHSFNFSEQSSRRKKKTRKELERQIWFEWEETDERKSEKRRGDERIGVKRKDHRGEKVKKWSEFTRKRKHDGKQHLNKKFGSNHASSKKNTHGSLKKTMVETCHGNAAGLMPRLVLNLHTADEYKWLGLRK